MNAEEIGIAHMQCWLFRLAETSWNRSPAEINAIFKKHGIFNFISECYDSLHLMGYENILERIEELLLKEGCVVS